MEIPLNLQQLFPIMLVFLRGYHKRCLLLVKFHAVNHVIQQDFEGSSKSHFSTVSEGSINWIS